MRQILVSTFLICLFIASTAKSENRSTLHSASTQIKKRFTNKARSGFYLEIKRSYVRAYSGWQKKTITLLRLNGFAAFNGEPNKRISIREISTMESIERTSRPRLIISAVYVGPYQSRGPAG